MINNKAHLKAYFTLLFGVIACLGIALPLTACASAPRSVKPDVHLTFDIHENGSNVTTLEVAFHPLVDPFVRRGVDLARKHLPKGANISTLDYRETTREGRKYAAVEAQFDSLGDLNAFVNTPQLLSGLLGLLAPQTTIPPLFEEFEAWQDLDAPQRTYGVRASIGPKTTEALAFMNLAIHVRLPYSATQHNADSVKGTELSWQVVAGEPLHMEAAATQPSGLTIPQPDISGIRPSILLGLGAIILLAAAAGIVVAYRRAARAPDEHWDEYS